MLYEVDWAEDGTYRPGEFNSPENFQLIAWRTARSLTFN